MAIYREDVVNIELTSGTIFRSFMNHAIGAGDSKANRFGVRLFRNGELVSAESATVTGLFMAPDGTRYVISETSYPGSTGTEGNKAYVQLPGVCYAVTGQFALAIKLTGGGVEGTMRIVDGTVDETGEDGAVVPTSTIPTTEEIIAAYEQATAVMGGSVRFDATQSLTNAEKEKARNNIGAANKEEAIKTYKTIIASDQESLDNQGDYSDLDTVPANTITSYYLTNAILPHSPPINYKNARATVLCYTSNPAYVSGAGTVQVWIDAYDGKIWYRICWESSNTWSNWYGNGAEQNDILFPSKLTKASYFKTTRTSANQGDIIVVCGIYATTSGEYQTVGDQYFSITGVVDGDEEYIAQYCSFTGEPFAIKATKNYTSIKLALTSNYVSAMANDDYAIIGLTVHNSKDHVSSAEMAKKTNENAGVLGRYKAKNCNICRMHGMSAKSGDVLTIRPVYTNTTATSMFVFGMYGNVQSEGYDTLGAVSIGEIAQFTCQRDYATFQTWFGVPSSFDGDTLEVVVDAAVNMMPGVQKDIIQLQKRPVLNARTCNIFHKVVCIGDSYTSGHIQTPEEQTATGTNEAYAWPRFMAQLTGNEYVNCGISGATTISWQTGARGLPKAQSTGRVQAYIIGLAINDSGLVNNERRVPVGVVSDIGTDNLTYYAQLSKIIREVNTISPLAKIFVNTCPKDEPERYDPYNQAIRNIVSAYANTYPVHCVDLAANYMDLYNAVSLSGDYTHSHYTALGYEQFAEIYAYVLSDYINTHISAFQDVYKIPYDD